MTKNSNRLFTIAVALLLLAFISVDANAQCCGAAAAYAPAYTAGYAPAYTSYYAPAYGASYAPAYTSYYGGGWYPGYWMDRVRARLWGSPSTYVAAYPATYAASYAPTYAASYQPSYAASYGGYATSYAAPSCPSCCPTCSTCSSCSASYAPSCGCESCSSGSESYSGGSGYSAPAAPQASYQAPQPSCCGYNNGAQSAYAGQPQSAGSPPIVAAPGTTVIQQNGASPTPEPRPAIEANQQTPPPTFRNLPTESTQPTPHPEYDVKKTDNSSYLEAPKLFNPRDRTAQRSIAPVRTALYEQPVSYRGVSASRTTITAQQAQKDAAGWTSASN